MATQSRRRRNPQMLPRSDETMQLDGGEAPLYLPTSVAIRIFANLERDDLDKCVRVCKRWKWLVEYGEGVLPKRQLDCLEMSSRKEFTFTLYYGTRVQRFAFKKYFTDRDIYGMEVKRDAQSHEAVFRDDACDYRFPCGVPMEEEISPTMEFREFGQFHHEICRRRGQKLIYKGRVAYGKKLFTPPLEYYERLGWLLRNCDVKRLVLCAFSLTDEFVEKLAQHLPSLPLEVRSLFIHSCRLRSISTTVFHRLLTVVVSARRYILDDLRFCLPDHVNGRLLLHPSILGAEIFCVQGVLSRYATLLNVNVDLKAFRTFVREVQTYRAGEGDKAPQRLFFGLSSARLLPDEAIRDYKEIYADSTNQNALYPHVLIGQDRFRSPQLEEAMRGAGAQ